jgi:HD-like signal output (HDOD) protein
MVSPPLTHRPSSPATPEVAARLSNLPPLNAIANQVLVLSENPDTDLSQLAAIMECDPALAADVLFIANSSLFGIPSRIQVVRHAVAVLGLERIKSLAVTVAMRSFLGKPEPLISSCWRHSVGSAVVAREISKAFHITPDTAFTIALLHDIGRLGLLKSCPSEYGPVLASSFESIEEVLKAERVAAQVDHGLAGAWLVKSWALPQPFVETCERHHEELSANDSELLQVVKVSCRIADALGFSAVRYTDPPQYDDVIRALPSHIRSNRFPSEAELRKDVEERLKSFA